MDWNIAMIVGFIVGIGGVFICMSIVAFCIIRMEFDLMAHNIKIPMFHLFRHFIVYREYNKLAKSKSKGSEIEKFSRKIILIKRTLFSAPFILIIGLLIMLIGKAYNTD